MLKDLLAIYGAYRLLTDDDGGGRKNGNDGDFGCGCLLLIGIVTVVLTVMFIKATFGADPD